MTKTIRLYHGTNKKYKKINLGNLYSFTEGVGLYTSKDMTYSMTYTGKSSMIPQVHSKSLTRNSIFNGYKHNLDKSVSKIFYFDCPVDLINNEEDKHIKVYDFFKFEKEMGLSSDDMKKVNFNQPDFLIFSEIMKLLLCGDNVNKREKIMKKGFDFMNNLGYNVIEVKQPNRNMVDRFYLIINYDLIMKGNSYEVEGI